MTLMTETEMKEVLGGENSRSLNNVPNSVVLKIKRTLFPPKLQEKHSNFSTMHVSLTLKPTPTDSFQPLKEEEKKNGYSLQASSCTP